MPGIGVGNSPCFTRQARFHPSSISGLFAWYLYTTGSPSSWTDLSGNGRHLVQATASKQPTFSGSSVDFDGVDDTMAWVGTMTQPVHYFGVLTPTVSGTYANATPIDGGSGNTGRIYLASANQLVWTTDGANQISDFDGGGLGLDSKGLIEMTANGASSKIRWQNRTAVPGNAGVGDAGGITLGTFGDGVSAPCDCSLFELVLYDRVLSSGESDQVRAYLAQRHTVAA